MLIACPVNEYACPTADMRVHKQGFGVPQLMAASRGIPRLLELVNVSTYPTGKADVDEVDVS